MLARCWIGLGSTWEIFQNGLKPYACGVVAHPAIDAVRVAARKYGFGPADVEGIDLDVHPLTLALTGRRDPQTGLEGKFSVTFACAVALIEGTARKNQFTDEKVHQPDIRQLMSRIEAKANPSIPYTEARATLRLKDGRTLTEHVQAATGTPGNPISDNELDDKVRELLEPTLGAPRAQHLMGLVHDLPSVKDVSVLASGATKMR